jgi:UDP-4-amino-4,6-dideoxy-N-acetyl-beta-L-altrosamine N-acetyltransferase
MYTFKNFTDLNIDEKKIVLEWRNHESIRKWMYNTDTIALENHLQFIAKLKADKTRLYFLVKRNEIPIGVFSLIDIIHNSGDWGYYIAPLHQRNYGVEFYYYSLLFIYSVIKLSKVIGYALVDNKSANRFSDLFGFSKVLVLKEFRNETKEYYFREMTREVWEEEIVDNYKIKRFLDLTISN